MSSHHVIKDVTETLRDILWQGYSRPGQDGITQYISGPEDIVFSNPTDTARDSTKRLSLWLYQVTENEFVKNQPMLRADREQPELERFPPLALDFHYLLTPFGASMEANHMILGKTLQVLYDNATVYVRNPGDEVVEELRVILCRLSLEELTRVWEALRESYRLSVCYRLRVNRISSERLPSGARVYERSVGIRDEPRALRVAGR